MGIAEQVYDLLFANNVRADVMNQIMEILKASGNDAAVVKMNARRVAQISFRLEGITPGPWMWRLAGGNGWPLKIYSHDTLICVMADSQKGGPQELRNAEFIQHAAGDMRALLAEVQRLQVIERNQTETV